MSRILIGILFLIPFTIFAFCALSFVGLIALKLGVI